VYPQHYPYCTHTVLILYSYCTHTVLFSSTGGLLGSSCTHTVLILYSSPPQVASWAHPVLLLYSYFTLLLHWWPPGLILYSSCSHTILFSSTGGLLGSSWDGVLHTFQRLDSLILELGEGKGGVGQGGSSSSSLGMGGFGSSGGDASSAADSSSGSGGGASGLSTTYGHGPSAWEVSVEIDRDELIILDRALQRLFETTTSLDDQAIHHVILALGGLSLHTLANAATSSKGGLSTDGSSTGGSTESSDAFMPSPPASCQVHEFKSSSGGSGGSGSGASGGSGSSSARSPRRGDSTASSLRADSTASSFQSRGSSFSPSYSIPSRASRERPSFALRKLVETARCNIHRLANGSLWELTAGHLNIVANDRYCTHCVYYYCTHCIYWYCTHYSLLYSLLNIVNDRYYTLYSLHTTVLTIEYRRQRQVLHTLLTTHYCTHY
jgi:hypothetical protein